MQIVGCIRPPGPATFRVYSYYYYYSRGVRPKDAMFDSFRLLKTNRQLAMFRLGTILQMRRKIKNSPLRPPFRLNVITYEHMCPRGRTHVEMLCLDLAETLTL
ncbi:hypothetical protein CISG_07059 [Coccidioides immitis RMSCC 3703]|uniref:Uncharacterized protein n=1 Tax=Coccidioides immitis RMSCC 3703 TaxID=454286 RepID=A0A0J8QZB1_COCIT|nr:hypothetical protein CISG_07059 [Coccidioides immitis RMSCC 3703]